MTVALGTQGAPAALCSPGRAALAVVGLKARSWQRSRPARPRGAWRGARTAPAPDRSGHMCPHRHGPARAGYRRDLVPRPALSSPLIPARLARGWILFLPRPGARRWRGAKERRGVRRVPRGAGPGSPARLLSAEPLPVPRHGEGVAKCPRPQRLLQEGRRAPGGRETAATAGAPWLGAWGSLPVSLRCRRALSTDAEKASIHLLRAAVNHPPAMPVAALPSQPGCPAARGSPGQG